MAVVAGILLQGYVDFVNEYIKPLGKIFLNPLKFIVVPLVLFSIMAGILSMNDVSKVGKLGLRVLIYFMFRRVIVLPIGIPGGSLALMAMAMPPTPSSCRTGFQNIADNFTSLIFPNIVSRMFF